MNRRGSWYILPAGIIRIHWPISSWDTFRREEKLRFLALSIGRLDKDTSGAVLFAKTKLSAARLSKERELGRYEKEYLALAEGYFGENAGEIHIPVSQQVPGSHPIRMKKDPENGKEAHTYWKLEKQFPEAALLRIHITTGRTHQIRVHMAGIGHPLLGDPLYGKDCKDFSRAALHAHVLHLTHPVTGNRSAIESPLPLDFTESIRDLIRRCKAYISIPPHPPLSAPRT